MSDTAWGDRDRAGAPCWPRIPLRGPVSPGKLSEHLQQAEVELIDELSCNLAAYHGDVTDRMLCAGLRQGGVDTCQVGPGVGPELPRGAVASAGPS